MDHRRRSLRLHQCGSAVGVGLHQCGSAVGVQNERRNSAKDETASLKVGCIDLEDEDFDDFEEYPRRSQLNEHLITIKSEKRTIDVPNTSKKRKKSKKENINEEEDELEAENVFEQENKGVHNTHVRVSPKIFIKMVSSMSELQQKWVNETGFGDFLNFKINLLPHRLGYRVLSCYNHSNMTLELPSGEIVVREHDVNEVLGLPRGKERIDLKHKNMDMENMWRNQFLGIDHHKITTKMILEKMRVCGEVDNMFKMNFLVILTNVFIQSNSNAFVNKQILRFNGDINNCVGYNWCELVCDSLCESTPIWKKDPASKSFTGPLIFLIILYVDRLVYNERRIVDRTMPTWVGWSSSLLRQRSREELGDNSFGEGVIEPSQWDVTNKNHKAKGPSEDFFSDKQEENIEKELFKRVEGSACRLIASVAEFEANMDAYREIFPADPRTKDIDVMVMKVVRKFVVSRSFTHEEVCIVEKCTNDTFVVDTSKSHVLVDEKDVDVPYFTTPLGTPNFSLRCGLSQETPVKPTTMGERNSSATQLEFSTEVVDGNPSISTSMDLDLLAPVNTTKFVECQQITIANEIVVANEGVMKETTCKVTKKREIKPTMALKSPYLKRLLVLKMKANLDEKKVWNWVFESGNPMNEVVFSWKRVRNTRQDLCCLQDGNFVYCTIFDTWLVILNHSEDKRSTTSPYQFFVPVASLDDNNDKQTYDVFEARIIYVCAIYPYVNIGDVDMIFFPCDAS